MVKIIPEAEYGETMTSIVEPFLLTLREIIDMPLSTGGTLHVESYLPKDACGAVLILHGYTESGEKLREMAYYFLRAGYAVFAPDHRGHGRSVRAVADTSITHVERFEDYVRDQEELLAQVVIPRIGNLPLMLYAHSMGGAVGALLMMSRPGAFARAVLTAPMIAPSSAPLPRMLAKAIAASQCAMGRAHARAFIGKPFDAQRETFEHSFTTSPARFDYYKQKRARDLLLQNCSPSYAWVREAFDVTPKLLDPARAAQIRTPLLLCQAALDTVVCLPEQARFVSLVPGAKRRVFERAKHEIYASADDTMQPYVEAVLDFLSGKTASGRK